jgi:hypothetical protein
MDDPTLPPSPNGDRSSRTDTDVCTVRPTNGRLDTQARRQAHTQATVHFRVAGLPDTPSDGTTGNAPPEPPPQLALRVVADEAPDVAAERTVRAHYLGFDEIADTLGLSQEAAHAVIAGLQEGVPYTETAGDEERVYLIPAAAIPPPGPAR